MTEPEKTQSIKCETSDYCELDPMCQFFTACDAVWEDLEDWNEPPKEDE